MQVHPTILLVEDDDDDVLLICRAFEKARLVNPLHVVRDGEEALAYLSGEGRFQDRNAFPLPFLLMLDLHMPKLNGFDVLSWIQTRPELHRMKVAVLTSSSNEYDYRKAMSLGAHSYFTKPGSLDEFVHLMLRIHCHWILLDSDSTLQDPNNLIAAT